jgi:hypothetical protein
MSTLRESRISYEDLPIDLDELRGGSCELGGLTMTPTQADADESHIFTPSCGH